ncbi:MAG: hypothetical protein COB76_04345 [Alphaproteobacteria bacterium]|nr:MAG: hypothetical protein COB76_04345 [Alphaproteobacteria bacterium]
MFNRFFFLAVMAVFLSSPFSLMAQVIHVSPDGPTIVRLKDDAASVIVGNPAHASVVLDDSRTLLINAGISGMTSIVVLGKNGQVILNRPVVSNAPTGEMIRIQNACINGGDNCMAEKMYYCAEGARCHDVALPQAASDGASSSNSAEENLEDQ